MNARTLPAHPFGRTITLTNEIRIRRPASTVFDYLADLQHLPEWNYAIRDTRQLTPGIPGASTTYRQQRILPHPLEERLKIVTHVPDRLLVFDGGLGPFTGRSTYRIDDARGVTTLRNDIELTPSVPLALLGHLASRNMTRAVGDNLRVLKSILEVPQVHDVSST
ncbi:MAG: SRPBCC family protein [Pseudonocardiaceae bacterium]